MPPYACPLCAGKGHLPPTQQEKRPICHACNGTGIVWSPRPYTPKPRRQRVIPPPEWEWASSA